MRIDILTLFPDMFTGPFNTSIIGRAEKSGILEFHIWNIRDFANDKHRVVDDTPYGGGAGMVLKPDVVITCIEHVKTLNVGPVIYLTPQGTPFTQALAKDVAKNENLIFLCGHYEGLDERVRSGWVDHEISIGDYVLTGGELAAMVVIDAVARMIPGVLGEMESAEQDSFYDGLLEHPHFTRPAEFRGEKVPDVLVSGNHELIRIWRLKESLRRTITIRPDLLESRDLSAEEARLLQDILQECNAKGGSKDECN